MPSDASGYDSCARSVKDLCSKSPLAVLRPEPPTEAALSSPEAVVAESKFGGVGRPSKEESLARRAEFLRLVSEGAGCDEAIKAARIKPERAAAILLEFARPLLAKAA
jgi:hypothetical protein